MRWIDGLEALRLPLGKMEDPYPAHHDGHPNALGHLCLAGAVAAALEE